MAKVDQETLEKVKEALEQYKREVEASGLSVKSQDTYARYAGYFVGWLDDDFQPGSRGALRWQPYHEEGEAMDWDTYMKTLNERQEYLRECLRMLNIQQKHFKPDRNTAPLEEIEPDILTVMVVDGNAHPGALLAPIVSCQIAFNENVISMLTDLDYRKTEPRSGT